MAIELFQQMVVAFSIGIGLCLVGAANAFLRNRILPIRAIVSLLLIVASAGFAFSLTNDSAGSLRVGTILLALVSAAAVAGSTWFTSACSFMQTAVRRPELRWGMLAVLGFASAVASVTLNDAQYYQDIDQQMVELEYLTSPPPTITPSTRALTDLGREIAMRETTEPRDDANLTMLESAVLSNPTVRDSVIRCQPVSDRSNCHGWVFTGGRYWITGTQVDLILVDNVYERVTEPRPGDLAVYRSGEVVTHTGIVRYVSENLPVLVEGKWGCTGVYLHAVDKSVYGTSFTYYRSSRSGHLLAGISTTEPSDSQSSPHIMPNPANPDEFTE